MGNKKDFKHHTSIVRRDLFEDFKVFYTDKGKKYGLKEIPASKTRNFTAYFIESPKGEEYNIALSIEKGKNGNGNYKETLRVMGRDLIENSELIVKILKEIE